MYNPEAPFGLELMAERKRRCQVLKTGGGAAMNLVTIIQRNGRHYPNDTAFIEVRPVSNVRKAITWGQFSERINRFANALTHRGVKKGPVSYLKALKQLVLKSDNRHNPFSECVIKCYILQLFFK